MATSLTTGCPLHKDHRPSLSLTTHGTQLTITCHGGCSAEDLLEHIQALLAKGRGL